MHPSKNMKNKAKKYENNLKFEKKIEATTTYGT